MVIVRITGGLGNQMFQYAVAKAVACKNNDLFKLDLSFYAKQSLRKYELNSLNINETVATNIESNKLRGREGIVYKIRNRLKLPKLRPSTYITDSLLINTAKNTDEIFKKDIFNINGDIYLDGYWQSEKYFYHIRNDILEEFRVKNENLDIEYCNYLNNIQNSASVSLHVRRGDYVDREMFKDSGLSVTKLSFYKKAIKLIENKVKNPVFFIFSDDMEWCKKNLDFVENKVFVSNANNSATDDMMLMKECKHNIIANSTFSWWGAWLNQNISKIVIVPKIWYKTNHNIHLAPKKWIKL